MGITESKFKCLILPAQSGKTRKVEEEIKKFNLINDLWSMPGEINIWISANNKLLVHQTTSRLCRDLTSSESDEKEEVSDAVIQGNIFSWTSGTRKTNITPTELAFRMLDDVDMVVCCAHSKRLEYINEMLHRLTTHRLFKKQINIWIDEGDDSINLWSKYPHLLRNLSIKQVTIVSATIESVWKKYGHIRVIPYEITHPACYRRLKDAIRMIEDVGKSSSSDYIGAVLRKHQPKLAQPGMRSFIPGDYTKKSHEEAADMLMKEFGFAVIILNGTFKELRIPGQEPIDLRPYLTVSDPDDIPDEFNITLARMYVENELHKYPLAITGLLCVERGITFQCAPVENDHPGFLFDYGIIPPITDKAGAYQTMARLFGNVGDFPNYKPCEIYSNSATFKRVENQEEIAVNLARLVAQQNIEEIGPEHIELAALMNRPRDNTRSYLLYTDEEVVRKVCNRLNYKYRAIKAQTDGEDIGFRQASLNKKAKKVSLINAIRAVPSAYGYKDGEKSYRVHIPCYSDINDPASLHFVVVIRPNTDKQLVEDIITTYPPLDL